MRIYSMTATRNPVLTWSIILVINLGVLAWKLYLTDKRKEPKDYVLIFACGLSSVTAVGCILYFV